MSIREGTPIGTIPARTRNRHQPNLPLSMSMLSPKADFSVNVETKSKEAYIEEAIGAFSFVYVFYVDNIEELTTLEKDLTVTLHPSLGNALASITYSTSRGILMTRFQGTALSDFILPVINPNNLLEKGSN